MAHGSLKTALRPWHAEEGPRGLQEDSQRYSVAPPPGLAVCQPAEAVSSWTSQKAPYRNWCCGRRGKVADAHSFSHR